MQNRQLQEAFGPCSDGITARSYGSRRDLAWNDDGLVAVIQAVTVESRMEKS